LSEEIFKELIKNYPEIHHNLMRQTRKYNDHWKRYQIGIFEKVDYLKGLPMSLREEMHYHLTVENYEKGAKIITRGSECKAIYFIVSGEMELVVE
jgi:mannose-6-phosphate isomerase-like protein (cupin superfamily)